MKNDAYEFHWGIPLAGLIFDVIGPRQHEDTDASAIVLRDAHPKEDVSRAMTLAEVTRSLERHYGADNCDKPFTGSSLEREQAEKHLGANWLTSSYPYNDRRHRKSTPLSDHTGLFRELAVVKPSAEGILSFARQYGNLTAVCPLLMWYEEVHLIHLAVRIWDLIQAKDTRGLREHFRWLDFSNEVKRLLGWSKEPAKEDDPTAARMTLGEWAFGNACNGRYLVVDSHPKLPSGKHPQFPDRRLIQTVPWSCFAQEEWQHQLAELDVYLVAKRFLLFVIDKHFCQYGETKLFWSGRTLTRVLTPKNLLGAAWIQFEQAIGGEKKFRTCDGPGCGKWFELSPGVARADKIFCSDLCRVRAYQDRKKKKENKRKR